MSDDYISRHAVLDEMYKRKADGDAITAGFIKNMPSVNPQELKTGWIPISERLPEKNGQYLVTVKKGYMLLGLWCGIKDDWINVIAWMSLPEPYKAEGSENEK